MRLRWLADRIERAQAILAARATGDAPMSETDTNEPTPALGTNEPTSSDCTNELSRGMNEPRHPVPPLAGVRAETASAPNRHERRRLAALARQGLRAAA